METVIFGGKVLSMVNTVGTDLVIRTVATTTSSISNLVRHVTSFDQPGIDVISQQFKEIDLEHLVSVIHELVHEYQNVDLNNSVKKALLGVNQILENIDIELTELRESIIEHKKKYFNSWRRFNCKCNIENIKRDKSILDLRYKILIDLLKININNH